MTTDLNRPANTPKLKRRWGMILVSILLAFLLLGGALVLLDSLEPEASPAGATSAEELPRVTTMPLEARQMERSLAITGTLMPRDEIFIGTALQDQRIREVLVEEVRGGVPAECDQRLSRATRSMFSPIILRMSSSL